MRPRALGFVCDATISPAHARFVIAKAEILVRRRAEYVLTHPYKRTDRAFNIKSARLKRIAMSDTVTDADVRFVESLYQAFLGAQLMTAEEYRAKRERFRKTKGLRIAQHNIETKARKRAKAAAE